MEEYISSKIDTVTTEGGSLDLSDTESDSDSVYQIYDIGALKIRMIGSVKGDLIQSRRFDRIKECI